MAIGDDAQRFLQGAGKSFLQPIQQFGSQIGGGVNIQLTKNRTNEAIKRLQEQQARMVEQQKRVDATQRAKLRQAVADTQKEIDRNVAEQRGVIQKEVRRPEEVIQAGVGTAGTTVGLLAGASAPAQFAKFAATSGGLGGLFTGASSALQGKRPDEIAGDVAQGAGEFTGRAPALFGAIKLTDPLFAATLGKYSLPIQKFLSQRGLGGASQPLVRRGLPAFLNVAQGIPADLATGRKPLSPESVATDLATGALFGPGQFGGDKSLFKPTPKAVTSQTLGQMQEASQRKEGLGLLADLDIAIRANDPTQIQNAARKILSSQDPKYKDYKHSVEDVLEVKPPGVKPTPVTIEAFHGEGINRSPLVSAIKEPTYGKGKYYSTDPEYAGIFGAAQKEKVSFANPLVIKGDADLDAVSREAVAADLELADWAKQQGYDGIINRADDTIIKFPPDQKAGDLATNLARGQEQVNPLHPDQSVRFLKQPQESELAESSLFGNTPRIEEQPRIATPSQGVELGAQRQFLETVATSPGSSQRMQKTAAGISPQAYVPETNASSLAAADKEIAAGIDTAQARVLNADTPASAEKSAIAVRLLQKFDKEGNYEAAEKILNTYDQQLRESGRFIQAASLWNKLSPAAMIRMAEKTADKHGVELDTATKNTIANQMLTIQSMKGGGAKDQKTLELLSFIADKIPLTKSELFSSYRYQNMLSNPRTHERNLFQNLLNTYVTRPFDLAMEAEYDLFRHPFNPAARDVSLSDAPKYIKDAFLSTNLAFHAAIQDFKRGEVPSEKLDLTQGATALEAMRQSKMPQALTIATRAMSASDRFFTTLIASGEKARLVKHGMDEEGAGQKALDLAKEYLLRSQLGKDAADKTQPLFVRAIDSLGQFALAGRKLPVVGGPYSWFVPFITTPINSAKQMVRHSPVGFLGGELSGKQVGQALSGTLATTAGAMFALNDKTTWATPTDPAAKALFYDSNKKPYSVNINGTWVPMWYFGPYALALAIPAATKHYYEEERKALSDNAINKIGRISMDLSRFLTSQTPVSGVSGFFRMLEGDEDVNPGNLAGFTLGQAIPLQGLLRYVASALDPVFRKSKGFTESIQKDFPGMSQGLEPYVTSYGEEAKRDPANYFLPYDVGRENEGTQLFDKRYQERTEELREKAVLNELDLQAERAGGSGNAKLTALKLMDQIEAARSKEEKRQIFSQAQESGTLTPAVAEEFEDLAQERVLALKPYEKALKKASIQTRAQTILTKLKALKTREEKAAFLQRMDQIGVLTKAVDEEIGILSGLKPQQ